MSDVAYLEPRLRAIVHTVIEEAAQLGFQMEVFETFRSVTRQEQLFAEHATQLPTVGTHHYGLACDLVKVVSGQPSWDGSFAFLGELANFHGLVWGGPGPGNLDIGDLVHLQMVAFEDQDKLFSGTWYPPPDYVAWSKPA